MKADEYTKTTAAFVPNLHLDKLKFPTLFVATCILKWSHTLNCFQFAACHHVYHVATDTSAFVDGPC